MKERENVMQYNILDYGAAADGKLCTQGIQAAIDVPFPRRPEGAEPLQPRGAAATA